MSTDGESIESYYHRFMQLKNDLKMNKLFLENIASNFKFLNNLQPEWKRHVTIVRQRKNLHEADFTQIYDFLKINHEEVNELRAKLLAKFHDPLALMAHSQNSFNFPTTHKDQSSSKWWDSRCSKYGCASGGNQNGLVVVLGIANQNGTSNVVAARDGVLEMGINPGIQLQAKEFDFMAAAGDLDEIEENDNHVTSVALSMVHSGGTVETSSAPNEEIQETLELAQESREKMRILKKEIKPANYAKINHLLAVFVPQTTCKEETLELTQESLKKMRILKKEIKPANYAKINHLLAVFVPQTTKSKEELFLSNVSNMVTVSKIISIPNEDLSDDTTPSVAQKFLNEVKSSLMTLQSKFVRDFKSLAKEPDESLDKEKYLELEIERLLKASVSHDIMSIVQNSFVDVPSDLRTELDRLVHTARTRRPQPKGKMRNARIPSASKSSEVKKCNCRRTP
nr:hypothetical protein [Tanacetum cinerariifolium]